MCLWFGWEKVKEPKELRPKHFIRPLVVGWGMTHNPSLFLLFLVDLMLMYYHVFTIDLVVVIYLMLLESDSGETQDVLGAGANRGQLIIFGSLEGHSRENFIMFTPLEGHFILLCSMKGHFIIFCPQGIQEDTFVAFFLPTSGHEGDETSWFTAKLCLQLAWQVYEQELSTTQSDCANSGHKWGHASTYILDHLAWFVRQYVCISRYHCV